MDAIISSNPFASRATRAKAYEKGVFWAFRLATYFVMLCAAIIFGTIIVKGSATVFSSQFPFINTAFLLDKPETLHVFDHPQTGQHMEMGERAFRSFEKQVGVSIDSKTYVYGAGGIFPCIVGTLFLVVGSIFIAMFLGIISAVYLSEYSRQGPFIQFVRLAISNLAGVPSIVFGLFGFGMFVLFMPVIGGAPNEEVLNLWIPLTSYYLNFTGWGVCLLSGWFTLAFMVLPVVITASEESLRAVPKGFREGSLALGATHWQTIYKNVLPYALPGILTSSILSIARVAGETAPIMFTAAYALRDEMPWDGIDHWWQIAYQGVQALPYHIYVVSAKIPQNEYTEKVQYGTALVFLILVMAIALASVMLRIRMRAKYRW